MSAGGAVHHLDAFERVQVERYGVRSVERRVASRMLLEMAEVGVRSIWMVLSFSDVGVRVALWVASFLKLV